jgi:UDP-N-acetylglucosamine acyltransferase
MSSHIHPTAIVDPAASVGRDVAIGPYCIVGPEVTLGDGARLISHVNVDGYTFLGAGCTVWPFASIGTRTQDLKFTGGRPGVRIGARTNLREYVTVNAATADGDFTTVGDDCLIMATAHVAHDCIVGNGVIIANAGTLAGHVFIEDQAIIGGLCGVHQFVRIGRMSITGGCSKVVQDIPPFMTADGHPLGIHGINKIGLTRRGVSEETQAALKEAYRILYRQNLTSKAACEKIEAELPRTPELEHLTSFVRSSERGITR